MGRKEQGMLRAPHRAGIRRRCFHRCHVRGYEGIVAAATWPQSVPPAVEALERRMFLSAVPLPRPVAPDGEQPQPQPQADFLEIELLELLEVPGRPAGSA